jgi:hypothetical protein
LSKLKSAQKIVPLVTTTDLISEDNIWTIGFCNLVCFKNRGYWPILDPDPVLQGYCGHQVDQVVACIFVLKAFQQLNIGRKSYT